MRGMLRRLLLSVVASFIAVTVAHAADAKLFEGEVGGLPIVLKVEVDGQSAFGAYFYRRTLFDIILNGEVRGGAVQLEAPFTEDKLKLVPKGDGYTGQLTTARGKTLPVSLRPVRPAVRSEFGDLDGYERLRLAALTLRAGRTETIGQGSIRWFVEPSSGVSLFRLVSGYGASATATINRALAQAHWKRVADYFGCPAFGGGPGSEISKPEDVYLSNRFISFGWPASWSCAGAAHPDFGLEGHSFDAVSGRELALDEVLHFGSAAPPKPDTDAWYEYRSGTFAPGVVALMKRLHPKEVLNPSGGADEEDCDYSDPGVWDFPAWHVTEKGLYLGATFARVVRVCDNPDWSYIPLSALPRR
jgi:hypothetical protein